MGESTRDVDVIKELNDLIQLDFDAVKTYEAAIHRLDDEIEIREDLEMFRRDHLRHIDELTRVVQSLGGETEEPSRDLKGVLLEAMTKLRSVTGTLGTLKAMRTNEHLTNKAYDRAIDVLLPPTAHAIVANNLEDERRHLATIEAHIERLTSAEAEGIEPTPPRPPEERPRAHV